jgi:hypothetical protein
MQADWARLVDMTGVPKLFYILMTIIYSSNTLFLKRYSMRIVTNTPLAERNRKFATYLFIFTFILLIGGFILLNYPVFTGEPPTTLILVLQVVTLPVAFVLTLVSVRMTNLWARPPRPDRSIEEGLKGLSKKSILYNYYHIPARHVLIAPQGVFVITTRWHNGTFSVDDDRWRSHANVISRFFSSIRMDGVGNPIRDANKNAERIQKILQNIQPDVEVKPLIVFIDPSVELEIGETSVPILYSNNKRKPNLRDFMRERNRELSEEQRGQLPLTDKQIATFEEQTMGFISEDE